MGLTFSRFLPDLHKAFTGAAGFQRPRGCAFSALGGVGITLIVALSEVWVLMREPALYEANNLSSLDEKP